MKAKDVIMAEKRTLRLALFDVNKILLKQERVLLTDNFLKLVTRLEARQHREPVQKVKFYRPIAKPRGRKPGMRKVDLEMKRLHIHAQEMWTPKVVTSLEEAAGKKVSSSGRVIKKNAMIFYEPEVPETGTRKKRTSGSKRLDASRIQNGTSLSALSKKNKLNDSVPGNFLHIAQESLVKISNGDQDLHLKNGENGAVSSIEGMKSHLPNGITGLKKVLQNGRPSLVSAKLKLLKRRLERLPVQTHNRKTYTNSEIKSNTSSSLKSTQTITQNIHARNTPYEDSQFTPRCLQKKHLVGGHKSKASFQRSPSPKIEVITLDGPDEEPSTLQLTEDSSKQIPSPPVPELVLPEQYTKDFIHTFSACTDESKQVKPVHITNRTGGDVPKSQNEELTENENESSMSEVFLSETDQAEACYEDIPKSTNGGLGEEDSLTNIPELSFEEISMLPFDNQDKCVEEGMEQDLYETYVEQEHVDNTPSPTYEEFSDPEEEYPAENEEVISKPDEPTIFKTSEDALSIPTAAELPPDTNSPVQLCDQIEEYIDYLQNLPQELPLNQAPVILEDDKYNGLDDSVVSTVMNNLMHEDQHEAPLPNLVGGLDVSDLIPGQFYMFATEGQPLTMALFNGAAFDEVGQEEVQNALGINWDWGNEGDGMSAIQSINVAGPAAEDSGQNVDNTGPDSYYNEALFDH